MRFIFKDSHNCFYFSMLFLILVFCSALSFLYYVSLQIASPGLFITLFFGFSSVWLYLSVFLVFLAFLEKKRGLSVLWKKAAKPFRITVLCVIGAGFAVSVFNLFFILNPKKADGSENIQYVILLGGGITKDKKLTAAVQSRVDSAYEYLTAQKNAVAVVTGGRGSFAPCPESVVLKEALIEKGIDEKRILEEDKARDTIENFLFSAHLLAEYSNTDIENILSSPVAVVTNNFHLARAERIAKRMGFTDVYGVGAGLPSLFVLNAYGREICSYIKLNFRILLTGKQAALS